MKIYPLGVGQGFSTKYFHNNYIISISNTNILIDAGTTLRFSLEASPYTYTDIDYILLTHFHFDHIGGLEEFLQRRYWSTTDKQNQKNQQIIIKECQLKQLESLLSPGLCNQNLTLHDYCDIHTLSDEQSSLTIENTIEIKFIDTTNFHCEDMISFALQIYDLSKQQNILFSSDIKKLKNSNLKEQINQETVAIFQDVDLTYNPVHAHLTEVLSYYPDTCRPILYAMHYPDHAPNTFSQYNLSFVQQGIPIMY